VPSHPGGFERFAEEVRAHGFGGGRATLASYHQMGSARMGVDPATSVVGADNESHEVCGLYVADASTFPNASGVNPMLSIYGIALRAGRIIAGRLA
jgi:choline dehydrogenase-like flavoprotein